MKIFLLTVQSLWRREIVRFYRQPSRVLGALGSPLLFWLVIGSGIGTSFSSGPGADNYLYYFFPGTVLLIVLFTSIFSSISLIEDRREGFFQAVLVAPAPRAGIVLGKVLGGASIAVSQGLLFLLFSPLAGRQLGPAQWLTAAIVIFISAISLTGLGFFMAWRFRSVQGFHAVMNLLLMPMWLLSGALFTPEGALGWVRVLMLANPLTYALRALRLALETAPDMAALISAAATAFVFGLLMLLFSTVAASGPESGE